MFKIISICKGGGYRYCRTEPPHPKRNAKGLYPLHRVLVENKINRLLDDENIYMSGQAKTKAAALAKLQRALRRRGFTIKGLG